MIAQRPLRFGLIGTDSSHSVQFTRLFADGRVDGGLVTSAWQNPPAADFPPSLRAGAHAEEIGRLGVRLLDSPEEVARSSDALLLVESDARTRRVRFERVAGFGIPIYVDTRFSAGPGETDEMLELAAWHGTLVLSGSPKRFAPGVLSLRDAHLDRIDLSGPLFAQPGHPGLAWYGVHLVDLAVAVLGTGCARIDPDGDRLRLTWPDGRSATLSGPSEWNPWTRGAGRGAAGAHEFAIESGPEMLIGLLRSLVDSCRTGRPNISGAEIREISAIVAAGTSALTERESVSLTTA